MSPSERKDPLSSAGRIMRRHYGWKSPPSAVKQIGTPPQPPSHIQLKWKMQTEADNSQKVNMMTNRLLCFFLLRTTMLSWIGSLLHCTKRKSSTLHSLDIFSFQKEQTEGNKTYLDFLEGGNIFYCV